MSDSIMESPPNKTKNNDNIDWRKWHCQSTIAINGWFHWRFKTESCTNQRFSCIHPAENSVKYLQMRYLSDKYRFKVLRHFGRLWENFYGTTDTLFWMSSLGFKCPGWIHCLCAPLSVCNNYSSDSPLVWSDLREISWLKPYAWQPSLKIDPILAHVYRNLGK